MRSYLPFIFLVFIVVHSHSQILIDSGTEYNYFLGTQSPSNNSEWTQLTFDDSNWQKGQSPFWYGDGSGGTLINNMQNNYSTFYLRTNIDIDSISNLEDISFFINYDDGFNLFINNQLTISENAPSPASYNSFATALHESGTFENFILSVDESHLAAGNNIIAIQVFNYSLSSSDIHFDLSLKLNPKVPELPRTESVSFSQNAGFYNSPFDVTISAHNTGDLIRYTLDCTDPETSITAIESTEPVTLRIDPDVTNNRPKTPGVILRACAINDTLAPSYSRTVSYIFPEKVKSQNNPGGGWPNSSVNGQVFDYAMDPEIIFDANYSDKIDQAMLAIPTMSLVTATQNLVNSSYGIYVNAGIRGEDWERPGSIELFETNNETGFQVNTGIRIRGGWSRNDGNPKHAFRLFFRSEYGDSKLKYPLFQDEGVDEFDKIDLRTSQNYSWSFHGYDTGMYNTMNRDVFSRDLQREMHQPYTRSRYYHLYLNGMYWGIYQTQERAEARYAASYFGGDKDDYDVVKVNTQNFTSRTIEATDGNLDTWKEIYNMYLEGFTNNNNYNKIQGLNSSGNIDSTLEVLVDIDNLIDYMLIIFYTGNFDSPYSEFGNFINNFYNIRNRKFKRQGFQFFAHDAEHSMTAFPLGQKGGSNGDRVNAVINVPNIDHFQAQSLHNKLAENKQYKLRFADRAYKYLYNEGLFTPERCKALFLSTANQLKLAIIEESARWGDAKTSTPYTLEDWKKAVQDVVDYFINVRTEILINQLKKGNLLPTTSAPNFYLKTPDTAKEKINGTSKTIDGEVSLIIENINSSGEMAYTTNGNDPRTKDGRKDRNSISVSSKTITLKISKSTVVKVRAFENTEWSPLHEIHLLDSSFPEDLRITEIHYNPDSLAGMAGKNYEFIELKNTGGAPANLLNLDVSGGIRFRFNQPKILQPGEFTVLAANPYLFEYAYQKEADGWYSGHLSNLGEQIILSTDTTNLLGYIAYETSSPWPNLNELNGHSVTYTNINPATFDSNGENWVKSSIWGGTPYADDPIANTEQFVDKNSELNTIIYPNPTSDVIILKSNNNINRATISIINMNGKVIFQKPNFAVNAATNNRISLKNIGLTNGIYIIQIKNDAFVSRQQIVFLQ